MRRNRRGFYEDKDNSKALILVAGGIVIIAIVTFLIVYTVYNNKINSNKLASVEKENLKISTSNMVENSTIVSSNIGKTVNEIKNITMQTESDTNQVQINENKDNAQNIVLSNESEKNNLNEIVTINEKINENETVIEEDEPLFDKPIEEGEIYREFAKENLVFSETLQEWITHLGIDIKAAKTTVVVAAEMGIVESIKNDPRYGLTVIIKHNKGYKTIYSNLLTSEFIAEGDEVKKGQSIGTVGNSAAFEVSDEPHLHFEIIKDAEKVDPTLYINF